MQVIIPTVPATELNRISIERDKRVCASSLAEFAKRAWHVLEPSTKLQWGTVLDVMCRELERIYREPGFQPRQLINVPPGPGWVENLVMTNRGRKRLGDIVPGDMVLTHRGRYRPVTDCYSKGLLPVLKIVTNSGRRIWATPDHNCLTPSGWVEAGQLIVGDVLAVVTPDEDTLTDQVSAEEARLLGYLIGDGSVTQASTIFTNKDVDTLDDFERCARFMGFDVTRTQRKTHVVMRLLGGKRVRDWRKKHGICGASAYTKRIPDMVLSSSNTVLRNFIGAYWSCDGMFVVRANGKRGSSFRASATTVSEGLARDLLHVLGRIGINARFREKSRLLKTAAQPGGTYKSFNIEIYREADTARFIDMPGLSARKNAQVKRCTLFRFDRVLHEDEIVSIEDVGDKECMCISVEEDHSLTWDDIVVHNTMKSLLVSVIFPSWVWTINPSKSFTGAAHEQNLAIRDARKMRILIESEWYQDRWPLKLAADANAKTNFENEKRGFRQAVPFGSMTGRRSDFVIIDDPLSAEHANSKAHLEEAKRIFSETLPTRINNDESAIIIIMQRLNEADPSGVILNEPGMFGYKTLILPMRFEIERADPLDWRKVDGELLFPERFSERATAALENILKAYGTAGQLQQRPVPRDGGMFKRSWFEGRYVNSIPEGTKFKRWFDLAATADSSAAYTAGVLLGRTPLGRYIVCDAQRIQEEPHVRDVWVKGIATTDKAQHEHNVTFYVPKDPGAGGKVQTLSIIQKLDGFDVRGVKEVGDKESRAIPFSAACEGQNVDILAGTWNEAFIDELCMFPGGKFKDQVDAVVNAYGRFIVEFTTDDEVAGVDIVELTVASEYGY